MVTIYYSERDYFDSVCCSNFPEIEIEILQLGVNMYRTDFVTFASLHRLTIFLHKTIVHSLIQVRSLRSLSKKGVLNPGIEKRLEALDYNDSDFVSQEQLDELETSESDFMNVHLSHRELEREMKKTQDKVRRKILEKKYFKQKPEPALLSWEEKEQIRHLHKLNPEKWNVHTLSESFPASESVIEKILRANWRPSNVGRISEYNKSVEKNWKLLHEGKLDISEETRAHLARFSSRQNIIPSSAPYSSELTETTIAPVSREFSSIVQPSKSQGLITDSFHKLQQSFIKNSLQNPPEETYVLDDGEKKSHTLITLDMYREKVLSSKRPLDPVDKDIIGSYRINLVEQGDSKKSVSSNDFSAVKSDKHPVELKSQQNKIYVHIEIPRHLKKKRTLYKLDDCYYDEDGELLYRVPGMDL